MKLWKKGKSTTDEEKRAEKEEKKTGEGMNTCITRMGKMGKG
jgi:hypothetical protein